VQGIWELPYLHDHAIAANIYCNLLSGISSVAHDYLGYRGLLLLFDESESAVKADTFYRREKAFNFLQGLARVANNIEGIDGPPHLAGLAYSRMDNGERVPFSYQVPSHLKIAFAITPGSEYYLPYELRSSERLELSSLALDELAEVFNGIIHTYGEAYGLTSLSASRSEVLQRFSHLTDTTRRFVKGTVEIADIARFAKAPH
jgi:hypothetical protein